MSNQESWAQLMKLYFNVEIKNAVEDAWFTELRLNVQGWTHYPAHEPDKFKGKKAQEIATELCSTIRFIKDMDRIPRRSAESGGGDSYKGKPTVTDLIYWVAVFRKNIQRSTCSVLNQQFVNACCKHIKRLVDEDRRIDASILAGDPITISDCWDEICECGGNRGYSDAERVEVSKFCSKIGLDPHEEFVKIYEKRMGNKQRAQDSINAVQQSFSVDQPEPVKEDDGGFM